VEDKKIDTLIDWKFDTHYATEKEHGLLHTAKYKGVPIRRETLTKYKNDIPGKSESIYWTPKDKKNYKTLEALLKAIDKEVE
jgi:hypothetical protein